ncbi:PQQ-like beta-propeller repeat protein [soil metagenome]
MNGFPLVSWCAVVLAAAAVVPAGWAGDWPQFRGPDADGIWVCDGLPLGLDDGAIERVWRREIGGGYSGITVADGRLYTMDRPEGKAVEGSERVVCLDAATGEPVWDYRYQAKYDGLDYGTGPRASVTVSAGAAYALGAVGHASCLDAESGAVRWAVDAESELEATRPTWGFAASPVLWEDSVIFHLGLPGGALVALARESGAEVWRGSDDPAGYATPTFAQHRGEDLMVAWTPEHIQGIDPNSGTVRWSIPYPVRYGVSIAKPIVHEGIVLVCGYWHGSKAIRLGEEPGDADLLWEVEEGIRGLMAQPLYKDGNVYLIDRERGLMAFELESGRVLWDDAEAHSVTPSDRNPQATLVWVKESAGSPTERALILNANGELLSATLTPEGFTIHSRAQVTGKTWAHPAYADGHLFVRTDSEIACWKLRP